MKRQVKKFSQFIKESRNIDDPRNNNPSWVIRSVLKVWLESDPESTVSELIKKYESTGFDVLTLSQIKEEEDIPEGSVIFTYGDDPSDLCFYKYRSKIFQVTMGRLYEEPLGPEDESLEELIGIEFNSEDYEDLIIALTPASSK
jgi:hypothetical protein